MTTASHITAPKIAIDMDELSFGYGCRYDGVPGPEMDLFMGEWAMRWDVEVEGYRSDDLDAEDRVKVGEGEFSVIHNSGDVDLAQALGHDKSGLVQLLYKDRPDLLAYSGVNLGRDIAYVDQVKVLPEYRGQRIGHQMVSAFLQTVARNASLVVLQASPLVDGGPEVGTPEHAAAKGALREYWLSYGFKEASGDYLYMIRDLGGW